MTFYLLIVYWCIKRHSQTPVFYRKHLTLILLTWRIWWVPNNASRWQMGFNSAFKGLKCPLTLTLLKWRIWWAPNNASKWQMGFNSAFEGLKTTHHLLGLVAGLKECSENVVRVVHFASSPRQPRRVCNHSCVSDRGYSGVLRLRCMVLRGWPKPKNK